MIVNVSSIMTAAGGFLLDVLIGFCGVLGFHTHISSHILKQTDVSVNRIRECRAIDAVVANAGFPLFLSRHFLGVPCSIYLQYLIDFELHGLKLIFDVNRCQSYLNRLQEKISLEKSEIEKPQILHRLCEIACIVLINFPITFAVKKVNNATGEKIIYCMWLPECKILS